MRLTLRTLLAYLDDILDPEDAQQLQRKIEDSEFATSLVHRIKDSVRQLRLDAPALDAQGIGGDLNSVAEYLDNVLPPEQVPALETACLEKPINLGEIASCHQILTLVLGEPAAFTESIRNRAYAIAPTVPPTPLPPVGRGDVSKLDVAEPGEPESGVVDADTSSAGEAEPDRASAAEDTLGSTSPNAATRQQAHPPHDTVRSPSFARRTQPESDAVAETDGVEPSDEQTEKSTSTVSSQHAATQELSTKEVWRKEAQEGLESDASDFPSNSKLTDSKLTDDKRNKEEHHALSNPRTSKIDSKVGVGVAVPRPSGTNVALPIADNDARTEASSVVTIPATPGDLERRDGCAGKLDRKITWQRSAFFTGLIALLILLGLMFASRPDGNGYFVAWLRRSRLVAGSPTNTTINTNASNEVTNTPSSVTPAPSSPASTTPPAHEQFDRNNTLAESVAAKSLAAPSQPSRWIDPSQRSELSKLEQPIHPPAGDNSANIDVSEDTATSTTSPPAPPEFSNEAQTQLSKDTQPSSPKLETPVAEALTPVISTTDLGDEASLAVTSDQLPEVLPESNVGVDRGPASPELPDQASSVAAFPSGATDVESIVADLPPRRNEAGDALAGAALTTAAAEIPSLDRAEMTAINAPVRTDSTASIEAPIELPAEEVPINPPVASPTTRAITSIPIDDRLPIESSLAETPEPTVTASLPPTRLRRGGQLLLALDTVENDWKRVDSTELLNANAVIQCLPSFRSDIEIGNDTMCTLVDATRIQLGPQDNVTLQDGKLLLQMQKGNVTRSFRYRGVLLDVVGNGEACSVAMEASRPHIPGSQFSDAPHSLLSVQAIVGKATVRLMGRSFELGENQRLVLLDSYPPRLLPSSQLPLWATRTSMSPRYKDVVRNWQKSIPLNESVEFWLKDRASQRNRIRALAARCLAELGEYESIVAALGDVEQHAYWEDHVATLRRHLTRGTDWVDKLQLEMQATHGGEAEMMMDLLRGYSQTQLSGGASKKLVNLLRSEKLEYRVLAFHNLRLITGVELEYQPEATEARRRVPTIAWEKRVQDVKYRAASDIEELLRSFAKQ